MEGSSTKSYATIVLYSKLKYVQYSSYLESKLSLHYPCIVSMGLGFCDDLLSFHAVVVLKDRIGILMVCLGIIYLLMSVIIIYFIKLQEHNAKGSFVCVH